MTPNSQFSTLNSQLKLALIGNPIGHSLSPKLFEAAYAYNQEISKNYRYDLIETETFEEAIEIIEREKYYAFNVTAPFKEQAYSFTDIRENHVSDAQAANLLIRGERGFKAYNSDYWGVKNLLDERIRSLEIDPDTTSLLVIGCGGAGRAAAIAARDIGFKTSVSNRTSQTGGRFAQENNLIFIPFEYLPTVISEFAIIFYTLPLHTPIADMLKKSSSIIIEANYKNPSINRTGYEWLYFQAATGFLLMTKMGPHGGEMENFLQKYF